MKEITILKVVQNKKSKVWIIERNDTDPSVVGEVTSCGVPGRAKDLPLGTTFKCILTIPNIR
jgi:hypothetical protein